MSTTWREFLPENAKFPFPDTTTRSMYAHSADINPLLVGSIPQNFKAKYAVPDMTLVDKLCQTLDEILGDNPIMGPIPDLLSMFGHRLEFFKPFGGAVTRHTEWSHIGDESKVRTWILIPRHLANSWDSVGSCCTPVFSNLRRSVYK